MLFQRIKRTDPEKIFGIFKNNETTSMVDGDMVGADVTAADGVAVLFSTTGAVQLNIVGIVSGNDIEAGAFGTVQVYGLHPNAKSTGATAGTSIKASTTAKTLTLGATADEPRQQVGFSLTATSSGRNKVFLTAM